MWKGAAVAAAGVALGATGVALATPGLGAVGEVQARGSFADPYGEKMKVALGLFATGLFRPTEVVV
ncbi:MAG: hypothetical protein ABR583_00265 [Gaiellaceae bacterium]